MSQARGIQSIEVGGQLLQALLRAGRPLPLKDLAQEAGMPAAKAHPYLVSFGRLGLVAQQPDGRYGLGAMALQLGLIGLQQHEPVRLASQELEPLAAASGCTVALALWGNAGPTVVRVAEAPSPVHVTLRHGTVLNLAQTATGQVLAAGRPRAEVDALWKQQGGRGRSAWHAQLAAVAAAGHAFSDAGLLPGVGALAVPAGHVDMALVAVAPQAQWSDKKKRQQVLALLLEAAARVQRALGSVA
jgi:DNA-binding IclR family transcriptional regulator